MSSFTRYFILSVGTLSIVLLIITMLTFLIYRSFTQPADIMFTIVVAELI